MLHTTMHFDASDIDKYNESPLGRKKIVYGSRKRFMSPEINMHIGRTFEAVGASSGDKDYENQRFNTTQRQQFSVEKIKFGARANPNPTTVYEQMAKNSRKRINLFGRQRGILAHEEKGRNVFGAKTSLQEAGSVTLNATFNRQDKPDANRERNSVTMLASPVRH